MDLQPTLDAHQFTSFQRHRQHRRKPFISRYNMVSPSEELNEARKRAIRRLHQSPFPQISNPEGCQKRASVALVLRLRPTYRAQLAMAERSGNATAESNPASLEEFLSQPWEGDPEVLFIK